jgi:hypothetical protein
VLLQGLYDILVRAGSHRPDDLGVSLLYKMGTIRWRRYFYLIVTLFPRTKMTQFEHNLVVMVILNILFHVWFKKRFYSGNEVTEWRDFFKKE